MGALKIGDRVRLVDAPAPPLTTGLEGTITNVLTTDDGELYPFPYVVTFDGVEQHTNPFNGEEGYPLLGDELALVGTEDAEEDRWADDGGPVIEFDAAAQGA